MFLHMLL